VRQLTAAQKGEAGGWHYVSLGSAGGHPIGYCTEHEPHDSEAEARECYGQWRRDHIRLGGTARWTSCGFPGCSAPANHAADVAGTYDGTVLCDSHNTTEHAVTALCLEGAAGDAWVS
jgi:hypothetical protein